MMTSFMGMDWRQKRRAIRRVGNWRLKGLSWMSKFVVLAQQLNYAVGFNPFVLPRNSKQVYALNQVEFSSCMRFKKSRNVYRGWWNVASKFYEGAATAPTLKVLPF